LRSKILEKAAFSLYGLAWGLGIPLLRLNRRLAEGYNPRCFRSRPAPADIWIQAASVGESLLAHELLKRLNPGRPVHVLVTTNTRQGMEILDKAIEDITPNDRNITVAATYFPFDKPGIMQRAVAHIRPRVMVLLESEMWPAHLAALKQAGCPVLVFNGRMTARSLKGYLRWPSLWQRFKPHKILAISDKDAQRFGRLFGPQRVTVMPNIKFDRLDLAPQPSGKINPLSSLVSNDAGMVVFGSVRRQEEDQVQKILLEIRQGHPMVNIGLFPRHFQRLNAWAAFLDAHEVPWCLRSAIDQPVAPGTVILWDTYGELTHAYQLAVAAFVGGSLAPLRGQNFLEPLTSGIRPVIGPSWEDFHWVGPEIIESGLVRIARNWREVVDLLANDIARPSAPESVRETAYRYLKDRQGGTAMACRVIEEYVDGVERARGDKTGRLSSDSAPGDLRNA
jgi:3-deoxy-D-manno-octulosonic-acid transferase